MSYIAKNGRLYTSGASEALTLLDDKFSVNKSYSKGDSCIYNDYLWKFTSDKPAGEWDSSVVEQCRIMDFVDDINGSLTQNINSIQSQITEIQSQIPKNVVKKEFKTLTTDAGANILLNGTQLTVNDYDIIIPSNGSDVMLSAGILYNSAWVLWNNNGYLYSHGAFTALCIKFN